MSSVDDLSASLAPRLFRTSLVRSLAILTALCGMAVFFAGSSRAATLSQPLSSAIAQYVESIPTASGGQAVGAGVTRRTPLPPRIARLVRTRGGSDASTLEKLATSSAYGAPTVPRSATGGATTPAKGGAGHAAAPAKQGAGRSDSQPPPRPQAAPPNRLTPPPSFAHALSAALGTAFSGGFLAAWLGLAAVTAAAVVAARWSPKR